MENSTAEKIYRSIFRRDIPAAARDRFEGIEKKMEREAPEADLDRHRKITGNIRDLAAAEYASRILGKNRMLVIQFRVMAHLGECLPENYSLFVNERSGMIRTLLIFVWTPFNSVYKFLKGYIALKMKGR